MKFSKTLEIIMMLLVIVTLIAFIFITQSNGAKCMAAPLKYAVLDMSKANNIEISCYCSSNDLKFVPIIANKSGIFYQNVGIIKPISYP